MTDVLSVYYFQIFNGYEWISPRVLFQIKGPPATLKINNRK